MVLSMQLLHISYVVETYFCLNIVQATTTYILCSRSIPFSIDTVYIVQCFFILVLVHFVATLYGIPYFKHLINILSAYFTWRKCGYKHFLDAIIGCIHYVQNVVRTKT